MTFIKEKTVGIEMRELCTMKSFSPLSSPPMIHRVEFANILRGFAAIFVVISHYLGVFWLNQEATVNLTNLPAFNLQTVSVPKFIYWINSYPYFSWGAYGVALFFLISGFVIPFSLQKSTWAGFLVNRFFRIFPTYMLGFSVTLLTFMYGLNYFSKPWPFTPSEVFIHYIPGMRDIMGTKTIDSIIWTLEVEIKFYGLCAMAFLWFKKQSKKVFFLPLIFLIITVTFNSFGDSLTKVMPTVVSLTHPVIVSLQFIVYMFLGVAFHYLYVKQIKRRDFLIMTLVFWGIFGVMWYIGPYQINFFLMETYVLSYLTFSLAFCFSFQLKGNRVVNFIASISYPLYIIHGVAGYIVMRVLLEKGFSPYVTLFFVTLGAVIISWIIHISVERPTQRIGQKLTKLTLQHPKLNQAQEAILPLCQDA